jgi:arylsulfatase
MKQPNILHLFTDMQRADTIGALGNPVMKTPALDRLADEGTSFVNAFTPSPVCISARCCMIYGQYPMNTGCYENTRMPTDERNTFMKALSDVGYDTMGIGKCHFTPDAYALRGFRNRLVQEEGGAAMDQLGQNHYLKYLHDKGYEHICEAYGIRGEMYYIPQASQVPAADHPTQWVGDRSIEYIRERADTDEPWYLFSSYIHPHPPLAPPNPWHKLYRPSMMPLPNVPADWQSLLTYVNRVQNRYKYRDQGVDLNLARAIIAYYYACVSFIDFQVGRILAALEETGQLNNTLILYTSDHGEFLGDFRCYGKRSMHDPSARVPMIVRWPEAVTAGKVCEEPASLVDLAPTFLSVAGTSLGTHEADGENLVEVAEGTSDRKYVLSELSYTGGMNRAAQGTRYDGSEYSDSEEERAAYTTYMITSREWKYFYSAPDDQEYLFDRVRDPRETRNRSGIQFCGDAKKEHKSELIGRLKTAGETTGIVDGDWKKFPLRQISDDPDQGLLIQDGYTPWAEVEIPGYTD